MLTLIIVVLFFLGLGWLKGRINRSKLGCFFGNHTWSMTRGFEDEAHHTATCIKCGAVPREYR